MDIYGFYIIWGKGYKCKACGKDEISWDQAMLDELDPGHRIYFPVRMMYKAACDIRVIRLLRQKGLGIYILGYLHIIIVAVLTFIESGIYLKIFKIEICRL